MFQTCFTNFSQNRHIKAGFGTSERRTGVLDDSLKAFQINYKNNSYLGNKYFVYSSFSSIKSRFSRVCQHSHQLQKTTLPSEGSISQMPSKMRIIFIYLLLMWTTNAYASGSPIVVFVPIISIVLFLIGIVKTIRYVGNGRKKTKSYMVLIGAFIIFISLGFVRNSTLDSELNSMFMLGISILSLIASNKILRGGK